MQSEGNSLALSDQSSFNMSTQEKRGGGKGRGPFHVNSRYHRRRERTRAKIAKRFAQYQFGVCGRCGISFTPDWNETLEKFDSFCATCKWLNLGDALGLGAETRAFLDRIAASR